MSKEFSPIVSEFESAEQEATPHDQVMAEMDAIIAAAIQRRKTA